MTACKCSPCGREFTGLSGFDRHQDVDYSRRPAVRCQDPATLGMEQNPFGRWGSPPDASSRAFFASLAAERGGAGTTGPPEDSEPAKTRTAAPEVSQ